MPAPLDPNNPIVADIQKYGPYGYRPKLGPAVVFIVAYALLALAHLALTIKSRQWWLIIIALGASFETAGIALRAYGSNDTKAVNAYIAQQVLTVVTPVFFAAIHFAILGKVMILFGRKYTFVPPKLIIPVFVTLDVVSLVVQGAGSGIAAVNEIDIEDPSGGSHIVVGGLAVQLLGYVCFDIIAIAFAFKAWGGKPGMSPPADLWTPTMRRGLIAAFVSALLVLLRSCFRIGEMSIGWIGHVAATEWYFYVFDATPVTLAVILLAVWHPSQYLPSKIQSPEESANDVERPATEKVYSDNTMVGDGAGKETSGSSTKTTTPHLSSGSGSPVHDSHDSWRS